MNLELLESVGHTFPEELDCTLDSVAAAYSNCCAFNRWGTLLAVGCNDGRVIIWDFLTRGISKIIQSHVQPMSSISWSRDGRKLLTSATDYNVTIHDVMTSECEHKYRLPSPVLTAEFHPRDPTKFLICPMRHTAVLLNVSGKHTNIPLDGETHDMNVCAIFDRQGAHVIAGNNKGKVLVVDSTSLVVKAAFRLSNLASSGVKQLAFARTGGHFMVSSADRVIRVYDLGMVLDGGKSDSPPPEPIQKLQDLVNKTAWKKVSFSGDGQFIVAASMRQHALYIWEKSSGSLVKILYGNRGELVLDVAWHPIRPIIASISSGIVSIWAQAQVENWSAFAPDFTELEENVEYEERESEFDLEDEDKSDTNPDNGNEDHEVDVVGVEPTSRAFLDSDEETLDIEGMLFLPNAPEIEDPETAADSQNLPPQPHDPLVLPEPTGSGSSANRKRKTESSAAHSPAGTAKSKKMKVHEIELESLESPTGPSTPTYDSSTNSTGGGGGRKKNRKK